MLRIPIKTMTDARNVAARYRRVVRERDRATTAKERKRADEEISELKAAYSEWAGGDELHSDAFCG
jgi:hypothetical protein